MRRFISALSFCGALLALLSFVLFPPVKAKEDPIAVLLGLPAPPPPNPLVAAYRTRDEKFYDKNTPPRDDAPIEELLDYWRARSDAYAALGSNPEPSDRSLDRIMAEIDKNHDLLTQYLNILPDGERSANFVKGIADFEGTTGVFDRDERAVIKSWLMYHTSLFSSELAQLAGEVGDTGEYLSNQNELLALARVDYDRAQPIINRINADPSQKVSQVLTKWVQYRHALDTNSIGDIERCREELKAVVEDKNASPGMRDLALDALSKEKEWSGRDEWYYGLLGDETLSDLRVNGSSYTGLTTLMYYGPDDKYIEKMLELLKSDNKTVRANAIRNLLLKLDKGSIEIVRALVPWLEDPNWAADTANSRYTLVSKLSDYEIPESVPGLIKVLNEKHDAPVYAANAMANAANRMSSPNAINAASTAANMAANAANVAPYISTYANEANDGYRYPLRDPAISALAKQKDPRAGPPLRRLLPEMEYYQQTTIVRAMIACKGFTVAEQVDGLEIAAKIANAEAEGQPQPDPLASLYNNYNANAANAAMPKRAPSAYQLKVMVGRELMNNAEISDEVARAVVDRIGTLDRSNKPLAGALRKIILRWQNAAVNLLFLSDLKNGAATSEEIIKLLAGRKDLREKQSTDVFDIRTGTQTAVGVSACLLEDANDAAALIENGSTEARSAVLACARLIRMPLPVDAVAANLNSQTPQLATAAERYLESEDSPQARSIVLSRHPGEAKILGATSAFFVDQTGETTSEMLYALFQSMGDSSLYNGWSGSGNDPDIEQNEKELQAELKKTADLIAVYSYDADSVRIYNDRVIYRWNEDSSRFRERPLTKDEFEGLKAYVHDNKLDHLPPFLGCGGAYCEAKELVMVGKNGGRRLYISGETHAVFAGLEKIFEDFRKTPGTLKYALSGDLKGLEIVIASDDLHAETVWKDGNDLKIAASLTAVRKKVEADIEKISDEEVQSTGPDDAESRKQRMREKREYEGFAWYRVTANGAEPNASQPAGVEFIPIRDGITPTAGDEQWKTRAVGFEVRSSSEGLFKIVRGRATKIKSGDYSAPLVTPNGRWVIATKGNAEDGQTLVRVDLVTNKEFPVEVPNNAWVSAAAYVPTANRVLLAESYPDYGEYYYNEPDDYAPDDPSPEQLFLVDPSTGVVQQAPGEFRPLAQQTFRQLQPTGHPNEYWAAIYDPEKKFTQVGYYETRTFGFRPVLKVPKIKFNSMSMYVDESANKVYFVYRGHLLTLPLGPKPEPNPLPSPR